MSLKQTFLDYLEKYGYMTIDNMELICKQEHRKIDNGSRRMRELMASNPNIKAETNSRGAIIGYKWSISSNPAPGKEIPPRVEKWLNQWKEPVKLTPQKELF